MLEIKSFNHTHRASRACFAATAFFAFLAGCATTQVDIDPNRECVRNFTEQSGFANYRTNVTLDGVSQAQAMKRLVRVLGRKGFIINENDGAQGYVNATFDAGTSDIQLSAFVDERSGGTDAELNYAGTGAGLGVLATPASAYRNELCQFADAMRGNG